MGEKEVKNGVQCTFTMQISPFTLELSISGDCLAINQIGTHFRSVTFNLRIPTNGRYVFSLLNDRF